MKQGTAVALGLFDGVHRGHQRVIRAAVEQAGKKGLAAAAFTFSVGQQKPGSKPNLAMITTTCERERLLHAYGVQTVFCPPFEAFCDMSGEEFVRDMLYGRYQARALSCGQDFRFGKGAGWGMQQLRQLCARYGIALHEVRPVVEEGSGQPVSSTRIRGLLAQGDIAAVNRLLGRYYGFRFEVVHGRRLGRRMNSPTINQLLPPGFALPRFGVYTALAQVEGRLYPAVCNIGVKPTVQSSASPLAETWISGIEADLYGFVVPIYLVHFQRAEQKFASIDELFAVIEQDKQNALRICETGHFLQNTACAI